jgi:predicted double-glycine peptidase
MSENMVNNVMEVKKEMYTFKKVSVEKSMVFEDIWEEELKLDNKDKSELLKICIPEYLFLDKELAGEIYSIDLKTMLKDDIDEDSDDKKISTDCSDERYTSEKTAYLESIAILPKFQKRGLGRVLLEHHMGYLKSCGYSQLIAHSTSENMDKVFSSLGFYFFKDHVHKKWYGTERTAKFCEKQLKKCIYKQPDDFSCGVYALKYFLDKYTKHNFSTQFIRENLTPNEDVGTDCDKIVNFLLNNSMSLENGPDMKLKSPMLVRYMSDVEHYSVVTKVNKEKVWLFDPWLGKIKTYKKEDFMKNWYSKAFGVHWGLTLIRKKYGFLPIFSNVLIKNSIL